MTRFMGTAALVCAAAYVVAIYFFGGAIYVTLIALRGFWFTLAVVFTAFGLWGSLFYLILLQLDAFDEVRGYIAQLTGKKKPGLTARIQLKILDVVARIHRKENGKAFAARLEQKVGDVHAGRAMISPGWILIIFVVLNPLFAVPVVRLSFPRERWLAGLLWVWVGTAAEVATWFLPLYGGASLVIRFVVSLFG